MNVRPARMPASTPAAVCSVANTHVVGEPTPWLGVVAAQCESLPPVAATRWPASSSDYQNRMASSFDDADGSGGCHSREMFHTSTVSGTTSVP